MNFKEAYKSVNDEIHGDTALLHAILNGEAKKKKAFSFRLRPAYTLALTAMLVIAATSVYLGSDFNDHTITEQRQNNPVQSKSAYLCGDSAMELSNAQYYGNVIFDINLPDDLTPLVASDEMAMLKHSDPLTIMASSQSGDRSVTLTFSKQTNLKALVPDAAYACIDGVYVAVESQGLTEDETNAIIQCSE